MTAGMGPGRDSPGHGVATQADLAAADKALEEIRRVAGVGVGPYWFVGWAIKEAYLQGVMAEREACAKVAGDHAALVIADAIRARSATP